MFWSATSTISRVTFGHLQSQPLLVVQQRLRGRTARMHLIGVIFSARICYGRTARSRESGIKPLYNPCNELELEIEVIEDQLRSYEKHVRSPCRHKVQTGKWKTCLSGTSPSQKKWKHSWARTCLCPSFPPTHLLTFAVAAAFITGSWAFAPSCPPEVGKKKRPLSYRGVHGDLHLFRDI